MNNKMTWIRIPFWKEFLAKNWFKLVLIGFLLFVATKQNVSATFSWSTTPELAAHNIEAIPQPDSISPITVVHAGLVTTKQPAKNEYAPISTEELNTMDDKTTAYINRFSHIAVSEMHKYGIPASIKLAQGLIESRAGTSRLAVNNNNHFGIKCHSKKCKKGHCINATDDHHKDFFRIYDSPWESWRAHSLLITKGRYVNLTGYGVDYKKWAHGLKKAGYATDKHYAGKLIKVIEDYKLYEYDK